MGLPDFESYREESRWAIFEHHRRSNRFYRDHCNDSDFGRQWEEVPIITRRDFRLPLTEILSDGFTERNVYQSRTSGSSGKPLVYAKDKLCHAMTWALIIDRYSWHDISYGSRQARFYGIPLAGMGYYKERFKDILSNRHRFLIYDMSESVMERYLDQFRKNRYRYLYGYTNSLLLFAKYLIKEAVTLSQACPTLTSCIATSEVCTDIDRSVLGEAFGVKILNEYGASELETIAFEDADDNWVMSDENLYIEILDDQDRPLPFGETGKIVLTALHNRAMPFIRYELEIGGRSRADPTIEILNC